ncbi:fibropellin-1-like [Sphaeramia orbicularis]|uniref:fibropellin-1-like n=1 Tax=Sphaeramia orbicularis TaxID=375764 RepID=UPI00117D9635|nr:fibropellin-1-like [Sphaeramia orbicularis]
MSTLSPDPKARGINFDLPTCGDTQCNSHGKCVIPPGGGAGFVCECTLGYRGESCEDTVNGALSVPLTVSVLAVIIGLLILAFIAAKLRQRQKKNRRRQLAARHGYNISV